MWYKPYGKTGKKISVISFGGMRFDNPKDIDTNAEVVLHAYRKGVNYFDTAPGYCQDKSEEITGAAVKRMKPGTFYVSTKCGDPDGKGVRDSIEQSLKRLGVEKIHFFHIWCVMNLEGWRGRIKGGAVAAALKARSEGLIEHLVVSSHMLSDEAKVMLAEGPFEGITLGYSAINFPFRDGAVADAGKRGMGVVTMNPLGGGLIPKNAERFGFLRGPDDPSVVAAALRFNVSNPHVTSALVGCTTKAHVDEAVAAVENFQPYDNARIESIRRKVLTDFNSLCTGCGYCLPCPLEISIPQFMDVYNMSILNDSESMAMRMKWHWSIDAADAAKCSDCGVCEDRCTQHLDIRNRLKAIAELQKK